MYDVLKGIALILLAVASSFNGETLGCKLQKLLLENIVVKHVLNFAIIYFAIDITDDKVVDPYKMFKKTLIVWLGFILFMRQDFIFAIIIILLLFMTYILTNYIEYYKKINKKNYDQLIRIRSYTFTAMLIVALFGFGFYLNKQYKEHNKDFSLLKFIFGKIKCDSLNNVTRITKSNYKL